MKPKKYAVDIKNTQRYLNTTFATGKLFTIIPMASRLTRGDLAYRIKPDRYDLQDPLPTFLICCFDLICLA